MDADKPAPKDMASSFMSGMKSDKTVKRLEQISTLRARGLSKDIDLPQLVVCGDQSAGKSSVLEGITHIPFPRDEGVCTKFPTEVILQHAEGPQSVIATIIPHASRSGAVKTELRDFSYSIEGSAELPKVIASAGAKMGIRGYGSNKTGPAFVEDVLRIKVTGPHGMHLSIVDLPGLIAVASEEQTEADVATVQRMVDSYIEKPRTIILAVVQASNDIANQSIIKKSKHYDRGGQRTIGIITKPDLINKGTEGRIAALAKNQDTTRLQLGFYLLKNPTPIELAGGITSQERSAIEIHFFQSSPWREQMLEPARVGIDRLRDSLQKLLDQHIEKELPKVRDEIKSMITKTEREIARLPKERPTVSDLRMFVSSIAMEFHNLAMAALSGDYDTANSDFFASVEEETSVSRLRALVHSMNAEFADRMKDKGEAMKVVSVEEMQALQSQKGSYTTLVMDGVNSDGVPTPNEVSRPGFADESSDGSASDAENESNIGPEYVTETAMKAWINKIYMKTRGRELPGNYNHVLLTELFRHQSKNWPKIAEEHLERVYETILEFVENATAHLEMEEHVLAEIQDIMKAKLEENREEAEKEMDKLKQDEQRQPITYNHYYTDNVQKSRLNMFQKLINQAKDKLKGDGDTRNSMSLDFVANSLRKNLIVNMDEQACSEALAGLDAYYKVAIKTFVDNVCRQVIERHFLSSLPYIFDPQTVAGYSDEVLERIAGEKQDVVERRKELNEQLKNLKAGLNDLRK